MLYHVSDRSGILRFDPRTATAGSGLAGDYVWAVDEEHLANYLLPRDCPRVCLARGAGVSEADAGRFLEHSPGRVIAVEWSWLDQIREAELFIYSLPSETFECIDAGAGYFVSRQSVVPSEMRVANDLLAELRECTIELRIMHDLWPLHDAVAASTLEFSMIRMRNAKQRN